MSLHRVRLTKGQALATVALALAVSPDRRSLSDPELQRRWVVIQEALFCVCHKVVQVWAEDTVCFTFEEGAALLTVLGCVRVECPDAEQATRFCQLIKAVATTLRFSGYAPLQADAPFPKLVAKVGAPNSALERRK